MLAVPFEDLDVHLGREIALDLPRIYAKVVRDRRGGFCYELNALFHWLLTEIGFAAELVSARIYGEGTYGPPFDHMSIVVRVGGGWLADVGYGDLFLEPLRLDSAVVQTDRFKDYRVERTPAGAFALRESLRDADVFVDRYVVDPRSRSLGDFAVQCAEKQTSPRSYFVRNLVCTLPTPSGRKTLMNTTFKTRTDGRVVQTEIADETHLATLLRDEFDIRVDLGDLRRAALW